MGGPLPGVSRRRTGWPLRGVLGVAALLLVWQGLLHFEKPIRSLSPGCLFHRCTGFYCPGCGGTRAFFALLKGEPLTALRMNPLFLLGLAAGFVFLLLAISDRMRVRPRWLAGVRISERSGWLILAGCLLFGVLRNLPQWPFTLLAPH